VKNKYNVGDLVEYQGLKATVKAVKEQFYFYSTEYPFYEYVLETTDGSATFTAMESAISLINAGKRNRLCECGAWAVEWATNQHSRWCPAYYFDGDFNA
jgi:hypothetical protein